MERGSGCRLCPWWDQRIAFGSPEKLSSGHASNSGNHKLPCCGLVRLSLVPHWLAWLSRVHVQYTESPCFRLHTYHQSSMVEQQQLLLPKREGSPLRTVNMCTCLFERGVA